MTAAVLPFPAPPTEAKTYGHLALDRAAGAWVLDSIEPHIAIRLKSAFPKVPKGATAPFKFPDAPESCADLEWFIQRFPARLSDRDRAALADGRRTYHHDLNEIERIMLPGYVPQPIVGFNEGYAPYPMQSQAIDVALRRGRLLLADDLGLGKTTVAIGAMLDPRCLPAAVVVQSHLPKQWKDRIAEFSGLRVHVIRKKAPYSLPPADVYIFSYSNIGGWVDVLDTGMFKSAIFDEMQELRTGSATLKYKGAKILARHAKALRLGLSASPIYNYGGEIYPIMNLIEPGCLGTWDEFTREWCTSQGNGKWIVNDPDALGAYLRDHHLMLRRLRGGRPVNTIVREVPYDSDLAAASEDLTRALAQKVLTGSFMERGRAARDLDMLARQTTGVAKARHVAGVVRILLEEGIPVILAGWHREVYEIWMRELQDHKPLLYTGTETGSKKDKNKAAFIAGETNLLIMSLRSGAGTDGLQGRCSTVVIGELDWSPKVHEQIVGRVDRPGQVEDEVTAIYCITDDGSDPVLTSMLGLKSTQARGITDPMAGVVQVHSDESRMKRLAERYLARGPARA